MKHFKISKGMTHRLVAGFVILVLIGVYILFNPPFRFTVLDNSGYDVYASIDNKGPMKIVIREVLINGNERPAGFPTVIIISPGYSDEWWPGLYLEGWEPANGAVIKPGISYGFSVWSIFNPVESITIKYRFIGIPFSHTIDIS